MIKQKGYGQDTFHAPPASRGFYAMPKRFQEYFLVGSTDDFQPKQISLPKDDKFKNSETGETDWDAMRKKKKERMSDIRHEFTIDIDTELWHHLDIPNNEVIARHNSWIKSSYKAWEKAIKKDSIQLRAESGGKNGVNSVSKRTGIFSKDHLEVFFDSKII